MEDKVRAIIAWADNQCKFRLNARHRYQWQDKMAVAEAADELRCMADYLERLLDCDRYNEVNAEVMTLFAEHCEHAAYALNEEASNLDDRDVAEYIDDEEMFGLYDND